MTEVLPIENFTGPITVCDTTPPATPALSPVDRGNSVFKIIEGMFDIRIFMDAVAGFAVGHMAVFG